MTVNVLGTEYTIEYHKEKDDPKLENANGYCELYSKKIVIGEFDDNPLNFEYIQNFYMKVMRHEIIHAFLYESGLYRNSHEVENWAACEEMVDWFAIQAPKITKAFIEAGCMK